MVKPHYVYIHRRKTDGTVFYVGKGVNRRAWSNSGRNIHWKRIVAKHGYEIQILMSDLSEVCAFSMEAALIKFYGRCNLCNLTDGGDIGPVGLKHSPEFSRKQSERMKGNSYTKGRVMPEHEKARKREYRATEETKIKISKSLKNRPHVSAETRAKIGAAHRGKKLSADQIEAMRERATGRIPTLEQRARQSAAQKGLLVGPKNPSYGIPKTPEQKTRLREAMLGRRFSAETLAKRSGENHPRYDRTIYTMDHPEKGEASGTRRELTGALGLGTNVFTGLLNGSKKSTAGWILRK
jgi:hypothetical protein